MDKLKIWYLDTIFVITNYLLITGLVKDKWARRKIAEQMCAKIILKGIYKPSKIIKLLPKLKYKGA